MRIVVITVAALVTVLTLVQARRAAAEAKSQAKTAARLRSVKHAAHQKPGQMTVPKTPKIKRS